MNTSYSLLPSITPELHGEVFHSSHLPPFPGAPGGFFEAELTHLNLHAWPSTLQTAQALLLLLALTWGSREGGWAAVRLAGHRGGFIPRTTETKEGI